MNIKTSGKLPIFGKNAGIATQHKRAITSLYILLTLIMLLRLKN